MNIENFYCLVWPDSNVVCNVADVLSCFREFLALVGSEKARATNMNCEVVTMVKHDQSEPLVDVTYCT